MPSDRLTELQRQRALAQEQLAWFDREIARESGSAFVPGNPIQPAAPSSPTIAADPSPADAERIIGQYRASPNSVRSEVRRGCFLYTVAAVVLLGSGLTVLWFIFRR